jgi:hypothetical protein
MTDRETRIVALSRQLRSVEAAAIAGVAFSVLFVIAMLLMGRAHDNPGDIDFGDQTGHVEGLHDKGSNGVRELPEATR